MKLNIPNMFTLSRAVLAPVFMGLLLSERREYVIWSVVVFIIAAITDYLDGWFARRYKASTAWGTLVDPLADKILTTAAFVAFAILSKIEWWMVIVVIVRDVATTLLRSYADAVHKPIITSWSAKSKTFVQMTFIIVVLVFMGVAELQIADWLSFAAYYVLLPQVLYVSMLIVTVFTAWTGAEYFIANRVLLHRIGKRGSNEA